MLEIWFIDDDENFMEAMKRCLKIPTDKDYGIYNGRIAVHFKDPGIDGSSIINSINNATHQTSSVPDIIFLDLRYPLDKRNAITADNDSIIDPLGLSGIKILKAINDNNIYNACFPIIFSEVSLNETNKQNIISKFGYISRSLKFIEKNSNLSELSLQINGIDQYIATKNCDSLKVIINKLTGINR